MPTPSPTPTPAQLVTVSDITFLTVDEVSAMIAADTSQEISDAKWAQTLTEIAGWSEMASDAGDVKRIGDIEFFEGKSYSGRLDLRNTIRRRYGYAALVNENACFGEIESTLKWF